MKEASSISEVLARELLDSNGRPMVEAEVRCSNGSVGRGSSPCGTSVGSHEAFVLRDNEARFRGLGVRFAVRNIIEIIGPALIGRSVLNQQMIDGILVDLDGTPNKSRLGGNAVYSVSIAAARAAANQVGVPLYRYLAKSEIEALPIPMFNMINGGIYGDTNVQFQEFLLVPAAARTYSEALRMSIEVFYKLNEVIRKRHGEHCLFIGRSAGYGAPVSDPAKIIETLLIATEEAGYGGKFKIGLDCAATHFFDRNRGSYNLGNKRVSRDEIIDFLEGLVRTYPIFLVEDPLDEEDFEGFARITRQTNIIIAGDDLFTTSIERLKRGISFGAANALVFKPNMIGTISEAIETANFAKKNGYLLIASIRAGGSVDDPLSDIALAVGAPLIKCGAPRSGERTACQNYFLRVEEKHGKSIEFPLLEAIEQRSRSYEIRKK